MKDLRIIMTGREKYTAGTAIITEFLPVIKGKFNLEIVELRESKLTAEDAKREECVAILKKIPDGYFCCAFDKGGVQKSSEEFSVLIMGARETHRGLALIVGGPWGLDKSILERADSVISFSRMTFNHQVFRVMLFEQIYRAILIYDRHPYHK